MADRDQRGQLNLVILVWMGLGCQAAGVLVWLAALTGISSRTGSTMHGLLLLIFGMALGGWANNLREIGVLKERVSQLESGPPRPSTAADDG